MDRKVNVSVIKNIYIAKCTRAMTHFAVKMPPGPVLSSEGSVGKDPLHSALTLLAGFISLAPHKLLARVFSSLPGGPVHSASQNMAAGFIRTR